MVADLNLHTKNSTTLPCIMCVPSLVIPSLMGTKWLPIMLLNLFCKLTLSHYLGLDFKHYV